DHSIPGSEKLMEDAKARLKTAARHWENHDYREAYAEAERALRPLRILMRSEWETAVRGILDSPVASPYAVSFYTLPKHWQFMDQVRRSTVSPNLLRGGDFELEPQQVQDSWAMVKDSLDNIEMIAERVQDMKVSRVEVKDPKIDP